MANSIGSEEENDTKGDTTLIPSYTDHNGYRMPKGFSLEGFTSALKYEAQPNDLFLCTYPKCGTTWTQHILYLILHQGKPLDAHQTTNQVFPHLEEVGSDYVQQRTPVDCCGNYKLIKTHLYYEMINQSPKAKFICIVRNPKDVVVSFFHHTRGFESCYNFGNGSFDTYFDLFIKGEVDHGDYYKHLRTWFDHRNDDNVFFTTYERMRGDPRDAVLKLAAFLGSPHYPDLLHANKDEILNRVMEHSSLKSMKANPRRWSSDRADHHTPFVRKGSVGGWDELLSESQADQLDRRMHDVFTKDELEWLGEEYSNSL